MEDLVAEKIAVESLTSPQLMQCICLNLSLLSNIDETNKLDVTLEELGLDAFQYNSDYVFLFIYDKENIIRNVDAFIRNYKREKAVFGTNVEVIVN